MHRFSARIETGHKQTTSTNRFILSYFGLISKIVFHKNTFNMCAKIQYNVTFKHNEKKLTYLTCITGTKCHMSLEGSKLYDTGAV